VDASKAFEPLPTRVVGRFGKGVACRTKQACCAASRYSSNALPGGNRSQLFDGSRIDRPEPGVGLAFLNIAASNGHAAAQARLAMCHLKGVGVERNVSYGVQLLVRAALMELGGRGRDFRLTH
jgi:TPR repeat protein